MRRIIGALLGVYGLVLLVMGLFATSDEDIERAAGVNANLWTGLGLLVVAGLFFAWALTRPIGQDLVSDGRPLGRDGER